jgi:hypothetical protein
MSIAAEATLKSKAMIASPNLRLKKNKNEKKQKGFLFYFPTGIFICTFRSSKSPPLKGEDLGGGMSNYNYIRHLNAFFSFVRSDNRLTSSHVSLYFALFQYWNFNRFNNPFPVYRENLMQISKIGSKNTYHKCMKHLHRTEYIIYHPQVSKFQPVKISMKRLDGQEQKPSPKQLDLFNQKPTVPCPNPDTDSVPDLTATSTDFDTGTVPDL